MDDRIILQSDMEFLKRLNKKLYEDFQNPYKPDEKRDHAKSLELVLTRLEDINFKWKDIE